MADESGLSVDEAAARLGVAPKTVRRWLKSGKLAGELVPGPYGQTYRIPLVAVEGAHQVLDVVKVDRPADARTLALAVAQAVREQLDQRDAGLRDELAALRAEVAALRDLITAQHAPSGPPGGQETAGGPEEGSKSITPGRKRPWWRPWGH